MKLDFAPLPQTLPQNIEVEEILLGSLMFDPNSIVKVAHRLRSEAFFVQAHRLIYEAIIDLFNRQKGVTLVTVTDYLIANNNHDRVGGMPKLVNLFDQVVSTGLVEKYCTLLLEKHYRRQLIEISDSIKQIAFDETRSVVEVADESERLIFNLNQVKEKQANLEPVSDIVIDTVADLNDTVKNKGITTGFNDLDKLTGGIYGGDLIILAARPSIGKSTLAFNIAQQIAKTHDHTCAVFSLEMSNKQIALKFLSSASGINSHRLRLGQIPPLEQEALMEAMAEVSALPIFIDESPCPTVQHICSEVRKLKNKVKQLGCVVIDYLQLMETSSEFRVTELGKISRSLKQLAKECEVPIILLSQLNRSVESRNDKRPIMSDLRDSGSLEQDADVVMMLYRDDYYNPDSDDRGLTEVNVIKNRNGSTGKVNLIFRKEYSQFVNCMRSVT